MSGRPYSSVSRDRNASNSRRSSSWLITYADLMTILVCFFVLIVSFSIQDQVKMEVVAGSMRNAFGVAEERRYAGDFKLDGTPEQLQPGNVRPSSSPTASGITDTLTARPAAGTNGNDGAYEQRIAEQKQFEDAREHIQKAILSHPLLREESEAITVTLVEEGLQIVAVDQVGAPMFDKGSAIPLPRARDLLREIAEIIAPLPNRISVSGHADASGQGRYSAFALTANRANAAQKIFQQSGIPEARIAGVTGHGSAFPLYADDPYAAGNRRITITLEPSAPLLPSDRRL